MSFEIAVRCAGGLRIEVVRADFCKDPIVPRPELRISSNKNLTNLQLYETTRVFRLTLFKSDQENKQVETILYYSFFARILRDLLPQ